LLDRIVEMAEPILSPAEAVNNRRFVGFKLERILDQRQRLVLVVGAVGYIL
jgi:hypothetical protein